MRTLGEKIKQLRSKLTQEELAAILKVERSTLASPPGTGYCHTMPHSRLFPGKYRLACRAYPGTGDSFRQPVL